MREINCTTRDEDWDFAALAIKESITRVIFSKYESEIKIKYKNKKK